MEMRELPATEARQLRKIPAERCIKHPRSSRPSEYSMTSKVIPDLVSAGAVRGGLEHSAPATHVTGQSNPGIKAQNLPPG